MLFSPRGHDASQITLALGTAASYPRACQALGAMLSKGALNPADITVLFKMFTSMDPPPVELVSRFSDPLPVGRRAARRAAFLPGAFLVRERRFLLRRAGPASARAQPRVEGGPRAACCFADPRAGLPGPVHAVPLQAGGPHQPGPQAQVHPHPGVRGERGGDLEEGAARAQRPGLRGRRPSLRSFGNWAAGSEGPSSRKAFSSVCIT